MQVNISNLNIVSNGSDVHVETFTLNCGSHNVDRISIQTSPALLISMLCTHVFVSAVMLRSVKMTSSSSCALHYINVLCILCQ